MIYLSENTLQCRSIVVSIEEADGAFLVELNQTCFCPKGGGQQSDQGIINGHQVTGVIKKDGRILHALDAPPQFVVGDVVDVSVEPEKRAVNAKFHSGGHAIAALVEEAFPGVHAVGGHHWPGEARIEFEGTTFPPNEVTAATLEAAIANLVVLNLPVRIIGDPLRSRAIQIGDYRPVPCGGTHVESTRQLAGLRITKVKLKQGKLRVSYEA